jgi:hypothetical protein
MKRIRATAVLMLVVVLIAGCAAQTATRTLLTSSASITAMANQFSEVSVTYTDGCNAGIIERPYCDKFKAFSPKFKAALKELSDDWTAARRLNDVSRTASVEDKIVQWATELTSLAMRATLALDKRRS